MQSKATTVAEYLAHLPPERRAAIERVRQVVRENLDRDYQEGMTYGMIGYYVPHTVYPAGYHCDPRQPLPFINLGSQKNHMALYLTCAYIDQSQDGWFREAWAKTGKKLDMGKGCLRFKQLDDLALDVIGALVKRMPARKYIETVTAVLANRPAAKGKTKPAPRSGAKAAKKSVKKAKTSVRSARKAARAK